MNPGQLYIVAIPPILSVSCFVAVIEVIVIRKLRNIRRTKSLKIFLYYENSILIIAENLENIEKV